MDNNTRATDGNKMDEIRINYDYRDIDAKTTDEKISLLLKIAFANYKTLNDHGKILFGNGKEGLCDTTRYHGRIIKVLCSLFVTAVIGFASVLFAHLAGK